MMSSDRKYLEAYKDWVELADAPCSCAYHFHNARKGDPRYTEAKCARESAWNRYCQIRDEIKAPVNLEIIHSTRLN